MNLWILIKQNKSKFYMSVKNANANGFQEQVVSAVGIQLTTIRDNRLPLKVIEESFLKENNQSWLEPQSAESG